MNEIAAYCNYVGKSRDIFVYYLNYRGTILYMRFFTQLDVSPDKEPKATREPLQ